MQTNLQKKWQKQITKKLKVHTDVYDEYAYIKNQTKRILTYQNVAKYGKTETKNRVKSKDKCTSGLEQIQIGNATE